MVKENTPKSFEDVDWVAKNPLAETCQWNNYYSGDNRFCREMGQKCFHTHMLLQPACSVETPELIRLLTKTPTMLLRDLG